jgi:hypothetical protein
MKRTMRLVRGAINELWALVVDDSFVAFGAIVSVAVTYLLSRPHMLGSVDAVGWLLAGMVAGVLLISVRRVVRLGDHTKARRPDVGRDAAERVE